MIVSSGETVLKGIRDMMEDDGEGEGNWEIGIKIREETTPISTEEETYKPRRARRKWHNSYYDLNKQVSPLPPISASPCFTPKEKGEGSSYACITLPLINQYAVTSLTMTELTCSRRGKTREGGDKNECRLID